MGLFSKKTKEEKKPVAKKALAPKTTKVDSASKKATGLERSRKEAKKIDKKIAVHAYKVLIRPIISEKATMGVTNSKYVFEVATTANKVSVKQAIEEAYGVIAKDVNIINKLGKSVRSGRHFGRTKKIKKAIVTLHKGDSIKLYEGI